jgi:hypothetical protein
MRPEKIEMTCETPASATLLRQMQCLIILIRLTCSAVLLHLLVNVPVNIRAAELPERKLEAVIRIRFSHFSSKAFPRLILGMSLRQRVVKRHSSGPSFGNIWGSNILLEDAGKSRTLELIDGRPKRT